MSGAAEPTELASRASTTHEAAGGLERALIESRQRWRQFAAIAADLAFETDRHGCFTFVAPETVLGWAAADLLGRPAHALLLDLANPDVFAFTTPQHRRNTWLRTRSGNPVCMALTIRPMLDVDERPCGMRGVGVNVTEQETASLTSAAALRRAEVLDQILSRMRHEVRAPRVMQSILDSLMRAMGAHGAAVFQLPTAGETTTELIRHTAGSDPAPVMEAVLLGLANERRDTVAVDTPEGTRALACPCSTRFGDQAALVVWRATGGRIWDADDIALATSVGGVVRIMLEQEAIQRELARQARTDSLTSLLNRRAFLEEASRRLDRLAREGVPGTLLFLDLDRLKQLNDQQGHEAGDAALCAVSTLLHRTFRPGDLIARLGGDEFAVWLDNADSLTAAERAENLRLSTPQELAHLAGQDGIPMSMSIGIATREPGTDETLDQLIQRADQAMYQVKRNGRGNWHVSQLSMAR